LFFRFSMLVAPIFLYCISALTASATPVNVQPGMFGSIEFQGSTTGSLKGFGPKVTEALEVFQICVQMPQRCPRGDVANLMTEIEPLRDRDTLYQLFAVNRLGNRQPYRAESDDQNNWTSPLEFLINSGDCEDYAIFKYALLRHLGLPVGAMRIVLLRQVGDLRAHAVLAAQVDGNTYILDNLSEQVLPDHVLINYRPVYSFNEDRRWAHIVRLPNSHSGNVTE
jgi:predicted transglutaminase-like cysteine proteinase